MKFLYKYLIVIIFLFQFSVFATAADFSGTWEGMFYKIENKSTAHTGDVKAEITKSIDKQLNWRKFINWNNWLFQKIYNIIETIKPEAKLTKVLWAVPTYFDKFEFVIIDTRVRAPAVKANI